MSGSVWLPAAGAAAHAWDAMSGSDTGLALKATPQKASSPASRRTGTAEASRNGSSAGNVATVAEQRQRADAQQTQLEQQLRQACVSNNLDEALATYKKFEAAGLFPSENLCDTLIQALCRRGAFTPAWSVYAAAQRRSRRLRYTTYLAVMSAAIKAGEVTSGLRAFRAIQEAGMLPNVVTYCGMISGLARCKEAHHVQAGRRLWAELLHTGQLLDAAAYRTGINVCVEAGDLKSAQQVAAGMRAAGISPDARCYNILIKGYARAGLLSLLPDLIAEMQQEGLQLNGVSYATLVEAHVRVGQLAEASQWLATARIAGVTLDVWPHTALLKGHVQAGDLQAAEAALRKMQADAVKPNTVTYTVLVDGYAREGNMKAAMKLVQEMERAGVQPNAFTFNALLHGFAARGRVGRQGVSWVFQRMKAAGVGPTIDSYNTLMDAAVSTEDPEAAVRLFQRLPELGHTPDAVSYTILIQAYSALGRVGDATKAFKQLERDADQVTDETMLNAYISALSRAGRMQQAVKLLKRVNRIAADAGRPPPLAAHGAVVAGHVRRWDLPSALAAVKALIDAGGRPDGRIYGQLVDLAMRLGDYERALQVVREMERRGWTLDKAKYKRLFAELCRREEAALRQPQANGRPPSAARSETLERFKFWLGLPNNYYRQQ